MHIQHWNEFNELLALLGPPPDGATDGGTAEVVEAIGDIEFKSFMRPSKFFISALSSSVLKECCKVIIKILQFKKKFVLKKSILKTNLLRFVNSK